MTVKKHISILGFFPFFIHAAQIELVDSNLLKSFNCAAEQAFKLVTIQKKNLPNNNMAYDVNLADNPLGNMSLINCEVTVDGSILEFNIKATYSNDHHIELKPSKTLKECSQFNKAAIQQECKMKFYGDSPYYINTVSHGESKGNMKLYIADTPTISF